MISCVLRAMRDAELGGQRDRLVEAVRCAALCVPPNTAAIASIVVRTTLLYGSCSVRLQPEVWQCVRSIRLLAFLAPKPFMMRHHSSRAARILAISR